MQYLVVLPLRFLGTCETDIEISFHPGSELRGAIYNAPLDRWCLSRAQASGPCGCSACPTVKSCPVNITRYADSFFHKRRNPWIGPLRLWGPWCRFLQ
jgi:hypothetical protein